jgi:hypothetical protein
MLTKHLRMFMHVSDICFYLSPHTHVFGTVKVRKRCGIGESCYIKIANPRSKMILLRSQSSEFVYSDSRLTGAK